MAYNLVPFPFMISLFFLGITMIVSKYKNPDTFIAGGFLSIGSILEFCSWVTMTIFIIQSKISNN